MYAQTEIAKTGRSSVSYKDLIRKNFDLRKRLKDLEEKYIGLENERKFLILHVKELQETKKSRVQTIEDLKKMIASLRVEATKNPQTSEEIAVLNEKIEVALKERNESNNRIEQLEDELQKVRTNNTQGDEGETTEKIKQEKIQLEKLNENLRVELGEVQTLLESAQKTDADRVSALETKIVQLEKRIQIDEQKNKKLNEELVRARQGYGEEDKNLQKTLEEIKSQKTELSKNNKELEGRLSKVQNLLEQTKKDDLRKIKELEYESARLKNEIEKGDSQNPEDRKLQEVLEKIKVQKKELSESNAELKEQLIEGPKSIR